MNEAQAEIIKNLARNRLNVSAAAREMNYCRNTIVYRVDQIKKQTGLDPIDFYGMAALLPVAETVLADKSIDPRYQCLWDGDGYTDEFGAVLVCAIRYSLGRMTYMPKLVMDVIRPLLPCLSDKTLFVIERDIREAQDYGADFDEAEWMRFLSEVQDEMDLRHQE